MSEAASPPPPREFLNRAGLKATLLTVFDHHVKEEGLIRHYQPPAQFGVRFGVKTRRF